MMVADHRRLGDARNLGINNRRGRRDPQRMTIQIFAKKMVGSEETQDGSARRSRNNREV